MYPVRTPAKIDATSAQITTGLDHQSKETAIHEQQQVLTQALTRALQVFLRKLHKPYTHRFWWNAGGNIAAPPKWLSMFERKKIKMKYCGLFSKPLNSIIPHPLFIFSKN
jgi:hypothetical protein